MSTTGTKIGGKKTGGRTKGTPSKKTLARLKELSDQAAAAKRLGKKRAVEILDDLMQTAMSFAAMEQRKILEYPLNEEGKREVPQQMLDRFWKAMECAGTFAKALAPFQDPTFSSIKVATLPPAPEPSQEPKTIDGKAIRLDDPVAISRVYQQLVRVVR